MQPILIAAVVLVILYLVFKLFKTLFKWLLIAIVGLAMIAFFSSPDLEAHSDKLARMKKEWRREIKEKKIIFDDYKLFSLAKKKVNGEDKIVGVGAFGKVWYFDEDEKK